MKILLAAKFFQTKEKLISALDWLEKITLKENPNIAWEEGWRKKVLENKCCRIDSNVIEIIINTRSKQ